MNVEEVEPHTESGDTVYRTVKASIKEGLDYISRTSNENF